MCFEIRSTAQHSTAMMWLNKVFLVIFFANGKSNQIKADRRKLPL
jgi:hypothetical protein